MKTSWLVAVVLALVVLLFACDGGSGETANAPEPTAPPPVSPTAGSAATAVPPPPSPASPYPTRGEATTDCVNGWATPQEGTPRFLQPLGIIRRTTGVEGPLEVVDMRYFEGPESPPSDKGYLLLVQRWYIRLWARSDPAFQGRFLVEGRRFGRGLSAVAPYGTTGWRSPDWIGFQYDSTDTEAKAYAGLPGEWKGVPYDFVKGGGGIGVPGIPEQVVGCLAGT